MRRLTVCMVIGLAALMATTAFAELQNVELGGSIFIRGNYITNTFTTFANGAPTPAVRYPAGLVRGRPIGGIFNPAVTSIFDWDGAGDDVSFVEQRTRIHVKSDFTQNVSSFIELDSYDVWGEDFRSQNYITGQDTRARSADDVEMFQAYIEADNMFDVPLRLRVGRQELAFGSQWLVGTRDFAFFKTGLSFDALRLTYSHEWFTVDAFASKLADSVRDLFQDDVDFYGVYGSWIGIPDVTLDAFYFLLRDDTPFANDVNGNWFTEWVEDLRGLDDYEATALHTVGARAAAKKWGFDTEFEVAYQFGEADSIGRTFKPFNYGDTSARFNNWAVKWDLGYTIDINEKYKPHVFAGFRYYGGEDNRKIDFVDAINPFYRPRASVSFNRLFSNEINSGFLDLWNDMSNCWLVRAGIEGAIIERLGGRFAVNYFQVDEPFYAPRMWKPFGTSIPVAPGMPWVVNRNDTDIGVETDIFLEYHYSADLCFEAGWAHLFTGNATRQGSYTRWNGTLFTGGTDDDGADYVYLGTKLSF